MIPEMLVSLRMWAQLVLARSHLYFLREASKAIRAGMRFTGLTIRLPGERSLILGVIRHGAS